MSEVSGVVIEEGGVTGGGAVMVRDGVVHEGGSVSPPTTTTVVSGVGDRHPRLPGNAVVEAAMSDGTAMVMNGEAVIGGEDAGMEAEGSSDPPGENAPGSRSEAAHDALTALPSKDSVAAEASPAAPSTALPPSCIPASGVMGLAAPSPP